MNRRRFLTLFAAAAGAAVVAPVIPAARVWSFPSLIEKLFRWRSTDASLVVPEVVPLSLAAGAGGNQFLTINWITYENLVTLEKNLRFHKILEPVHPFDRDLPAGVRIPVRFQLHHPVQRSLEIDSVVVDEFAGIDDFGEILSYSGAPPGRPPVNQLKSPRFPFRPAFGIPES